MEKRKQSILRQDGRGPLQEMIIPDFPDEDTGTVTVTKSRRVSFGANFVKEFIVGSAVTTEFYSEYEQAVSSSDSSNPNSSRSGICDQSSISFENDVLDLCVSKTKFNDENMEPYKKFCPESVWNENYERNNDENWNFNVTTSNIFADKRNLCLCKGEVRNLNNKRTNQFNDSLISVEKVQESKVNECDMSCQKGNDILDKKGKQGKFSSTICFSADSPTADMEFTEGCINLAKSIFDKKNKEMTVYIQAKSKESDLEEKKDYNDTILFESSEREMSLTKCIGHDSEVGITVENPFRGHCAEEVIPRKNTTFYDSEMSLTRCVGGTYTPNVSKTGMKRSYDILDDENVPKPFKVTHSLNLSDESSINENIENIPPSMNAINMNLGLGEECEEDLERSLFFPERSLTEMLKAHRSGINSDSGIINEDDNEVCDMDITDVGQKLYSFSTNAQTLEMLHDESNFRQEMRNSIPISKDRSDMVIEKEEKLHEENIIAHGLQPVEDSEQCSTTAEVRTKSPVDFDSRNSHNVLENKLNPGKPIFQDHKKGEELSLTVPHLPEINTHSDSQELQNGDNCLYGASIVHENENFQLNNTHREIEEPVNVDYESMNTPDIRMSDNINNKSISGFETHETEIDKDNLTSLSVEESRKTLQESIKSPDNKYIEEHNIISQNVQESGKIGCESMKAKLTPISYTENVQTFEILHDESTYHQKMRKSVLISEDRSDMVIEKEEKLHEENIIAHGLQPVEDSEQCSTTAEVRTKSPVDFDSRNSHNVLENKLNPGKPIFQDHKKGEELSFTVPHLPEINIHSNSQEVQNGDNCLYGASIVHENENFQLNNTHREIEEPVNVDYESMNTPDIQMIDNINNKSISGFETHETEIDKDNLTSLSVEESGKILQESIKSPDNKYIEEHHIISRDIQESGKKDSRNTHKENVTIEDIQEYEKTKNDNISPLDIEMEESLNGSINEHVAQESRTIGECDMVLDSRKMKGEILFDQGKEKSEEKVLVDEEVQKLEEFESENKNAERGNVNVNTDFNAEESERPSKNDESIVSQNVNNMEQIRNENLIIHDIQRTSLQQSMATVGNRSFVQIHYEQINADKAQGVKNVEKYEENTIEEDAKNTQKMGEYVITDPKICESEKVSDMDISCPVRMEDQPIEDTMKCDELSSINEDKNASNEVSCVGVNDKQIPMETAVCETISAEREISLSLTVSDPSNSGEFNSASFSKVTPQNSYIDDVSSLSVNSGPTRGDEMVMNNLREQSQEANCFWSIESLACGNRSAAWSFSFSILDSIGLIVVDLTYPKDATFISFSSVTDITFELKEPKCRIDAKVLTAMEYANRKLRRLFDSERQTVHNVREIPFFLDKMNLHVTRVTGLLSQILKILKEYPGSRMKNSVLSFRLYSFPLLFSCMISVDLSDPSHMTADIISIEKHFGHFSEITVKTIFSDCIPSNDALVQFVRTLNQCVIDIESKSGRVTNRSHIRLLS